MLADDNGLNMAHDRERYLKTVRSLTLILMTSPSQTTRPDGITAYASIAISGLHQTILSHEQRYLFHETQ